MITRGSISVDYESRVSEFQKDINLLQYLMDVISAIPDISGEEIVNTSPPEAVIRMIGLFMERATGIEARMQDLGLSLERFHKRPDFVRNAISSLHFVITELSRRFAECQHDVQILQWFMDAVARSPTASGVDILRQMSVESIERMGQLFIEGPARIETRMHNLGTNLKRYGKAPDFLERALGSFQYVYYHYKRQRSQSNVLDSGTFDLMEAFMEHDTDCYGEGNVKRRKCSIDDRQNRMRTFESALIEKVCKWFMLGYEVYANQARQYGTADSYSFMLDASRLIFYFSALAVACRTFEPMKRSEYSLSENVAKYPHK